MTYRGKKKNKKLGYMSAQDDAIKLHKARTNIKGALSKKGKSTREKVFEANEPTNPARRFFYNLEKKKLNRR